MNFDNVTAARNGIQTILDMDEVMHWEDANSLSFLRHYAEQFASWLEKQSSYWSLFHYSEIEPHLGDPLKILSIYEKRELQKWYDILNRVSKGVEQPGQKADSLNKEMERNARDQQVHLLACFFAEHDTAREQLNRVVGAVKPRSLSEGNTRVEEPVVLTDGPFAYEIYRQQQQKNGKLDEYKNKFDFYMNRPLTENRKAREERDHYALECRDLDFLAEEIAYAVGQCHSGDWHDAENLHLGRPDLTLEFLNWLKTNSPDDYKAVAESKRGLNVAEPVDMLFEIKYARYSERVKSESDHEMVDHLLAILLARFAQENKEAGELLLDKLLRYKDYQDAMFEEAAIGDPEDYK